MTPNQRWRQKNQLAYAAHIITNEAIKKGLLIRKPCEICGLLRVHAHHDDYTKPLEIRWLCSKHHAAFHGRIAKPSSKKPIWNNRIRYQPSPKRDKWIEIAKNMRIEGNSYGNISKKIGVSKGTIYKWINPKEYS